METAQLNKIIERQILNNNDTDLISLVYSNFLGPKNKIGWIFSDDELNGFIKEGIINFGNLFFDDLDERVEYIFSDITDDNDREELLCDFCNRINNCNVEVSVKVSL